MSRGVDSKYLDDVPTWFFDHLGPVFEELGAPLIPGIVSDRFDRSSDWFVHFRFLPRRFLMEKIGLY